MIEPNLLGIQAIWKRPNRHTRNVFTSQLHLTCHDKTYKNLCELHESSQGRCIVRDLCAFPIFQRATYPSHFFGETTTYVLFPQPHASEGGWRTPLLIRTPRQSPVFGFLDKSWKRDRERCARDRVWERDSEYGKFFAHVRTNSTHKTPNTSFATLPYG